MTSKVKYTLESITEWLKNEGSYLVSDPLKYTTKTHITYKCIGPNCDKHGQKQWCSVLKSGPICISCSTDTKVSKIIDTNIKKKACRVKRKITVNPDAGQKRAKYTLESLTALLQKQNATLLNSDKLRAKINTKQYVDFVCQCGSESSKQVRDFERCGALCKICTAKQKSTKISEQKGEFCFNMDTLLDLLAESNATFISIPDNKTEKLDYNEVITYKCECETEHTKTFHAIREFGAFCKLCIIKEPMYSLDAPDYIICSGQESCGKTKPKTEFLFSQTTWKQQLSSKCEECRIKKRIRDVRMREKLYNVMVDNPDTHKKCTGCF